MAYEKNIDNAAVFYELEWDTEFFGVKSAKAILEKPLTLIQWEKLKSLFQVYDFVAINNCNSEPLNAQLIGRYTDAFLADVNIQFSKKLDRSCENPETISIHKALKKDDQILKIADFHFSKFMEDPHLAKRGGDQVYNQWLLNSFEKSNKVYALSKDNNGKINGFLLHSYSDKACIIELIAVSKYVTTRGIGTKLFNAVEYSAYQKGYKEIRVGTQIRNIKAINFYHKVGCKQVGCHQVYHLWSET